MIVGERLAGLVTAHEVLLAATLLALFELGVAGGV